MSAASAILRRTAPVAQLQFDWLVPAKPMLRVGEVATALDMRTTFVEEYFAGKCHRYAESMRTRPPMRIPRTFVVEELVKSAKYDAEMKLQAVAMCFREFSPGELLQLRALLDAQLSKQVTA